jgi:hypothetical protein
VDSHTLQRRAEEIARQYLSSLPADYVGKYSVIADKHTIETLFRAVMAGLNQRDSCAAAGISTDTFQRWMREAEANPTSAYAALSADLKEAKAAGKLSHLENIKKHSLKEWTASAWTLERTDPEQFGKRADDNQAPKVVVQIGVQGQDVQVTLSPPEQRQLGESTQIP